MFAATTQWDLSDWGLFVAIICGLVIFVGGAADLGLWWFGFETISDEVWETPWKGIPILACWHLGGLGLAAHFYL